MLFGDIDASFKAHLTTTLEPSRTYLDARIWNTWSMSSGMALDIAEQWHMRKRVLRFSVAFWRGRISTWEIGKRSARVSTN